MRNWYKPAPSSRSTGFTHVRGAPVSRVRLPTVTDGAFTEAKDVIGGGFGGKLDLALQPLIAVAASKLGQPVKCSSICRLNRCAQPPSATLVTCVRALPAIARAS
jgi:hypothetical protein